LSVTFKMPLTLTRTRVSAIGDRSTSGRSTDLYSVRLPGVRHEGVGLMTQWGVFQSDCLNQSVAENFGFVGLPSDSRYLGSVSCISASAVDYRLLLFEHGDVHRARGVQAWAELPFTKSL
jgi:hypothetical protein